MFSISGSNGFFADGLDLLGVNWRTDEEEAEEDLPVHERLASEERLIWVGR